MVDSKHQWKAWLYLAPAIVLLLVFTVWPIFNTIRMSLLEKYTTMDEVAGVAFNFGIGNFTRVLEYKGFLNCLRNTILLCFLTVLPSTFLALLIAVALNSIKPFQRFLQTIFFMPYVTNSIAIGMVFAAMFNMIIGGGELPDSVGIVNNVLVFFVDAINAILGFCANTINGALVLVDLPALINYEPINFHYINWINAGSNYWANMTVMVIYIVWNALPFKILILLGGLQSINKQYYDAAKVDGTPRMRVFTHITVPLLSPMLAYVIITGFIGGFKEYTSIVGIFGENMGPADDAGRLNTMVGFIYDALESNSQGRASAAALILFGIILVVTMINMQVSKKRVHY